MRDLGYTHAVDKTAFYFGPVNRVAHISDTPVCRTFSSDPLPADRTLSVC